MPSIAVSIKWGPDASIRHSCLFLANRFYSTTRVYARETRFEEEKLFQRRLERFGRRFDNVRFQWRRFRYFLGRNKR